MNRAKLVRDKIPQIIRSSGLVPLVRVAEDDEYGRLLREKLREEVGEFLDSDDPHELADVLEVLHALAGHLGLGVDGLETIRVAKASERGGFAERIVWSGNSSTRPCMEIDQQHLLDDRAVG
jgi:predicted house-cleaning noncanonical NTP pyrophosphatase (MazG superfamily)